MFEIHSIPTKWGWPDLLQPIDNPIYTERETMFEIHSIPTKWGWPDLLQPIDNPIYTERETMFEIHSIPTKWGWPDLLQPSDNPIYTERETDVWNPYYPHQVRLARIYFNLLTIQYIQRERPMFEIHIIPTKWGWPDLLQPSDNPIYTERENDVWNPYYPHQVRLARFTSTYWQSNIYRERDDVWNPYYPHQVRLARFTSTYWQSNIYRERERCLKSIVSPPSEVGRIYFNLLTIQYIQRERTMFEIHIIPTKWGWPDLLQPIDNPIYTERENDVWNP